MLAKRSKKQNLEVIKIRLQVRSLPIKFKELPANAIALFADHPELDSAIQVIIDQNNTIKNANGRRLDAENQVERLKHKLFQASQDFINPSKSEIIQGLKKLFNKDKVTKADDKILNEIGAVSKETALEDLEKSEQIVEQAIDIANKYKQKYGQL
ncbi:hypothetical protein HC931_22435 [Candidatus Gracilibacteria bacterium]|nr:hypothetical protein [Candidatus Gracilibacteria bacterium]NJM89332.1 hypothetical protein [Hydrococcus sp. RU_2_2]